MRREPSNPVVGVIFMGMVESMVAEGLLAQGSDALNKNFLQSISPAAMLKRCI